jgi:hypothetical protein
MLTARERRSIVLAALAAGFGPMVGGTAYYLARGELGSSNVVETIVFSILAYPFALIFTCVFGLPIFFLARRFHLAKWWSAIGCGLLVGCAVQFLVLSGTAAWENLLLYAAQGIATALLFFSVWEYRTHA